MSNASKCDLCGKLFKPVEGCVTLDVSIHTIGTQMETWSTVDFCFKCSMRLRTVIDPALGNS